MKKNLWSLFLVAIGCATVVCCGGRSSTSRNTRSGLKFRAFVSNPLSIAAIGSPAPGLNIIDASKDVESIFSVNLAGAVSNAGMLALSPNRALSLVLSPGTNSVAVVNNSQETVGSVINLPGPAQSVFVWTDNATGYAAVPSAPVSAAQGAPPGAVVVMNLLGSTVSATIPVAGAQYVIDSHNGNRIIALGNNPQSVTIISPSSIGTGADPRTLVSSSSFDHPVWAVFSSDDTTAYIFNCGPECGGTAASIAVLDMTASPPQVSVTIAVPAATYGLLSGSALYVAGTAPAGGVLTLVNIASATVTNSLAIGDGYHNRMALTSNGQLFIGAHTCTTGCLSIFNTASSAVVLPTAAGDVTGIQPIAGRNVVYVCQNGALSIYDATKDALQTTRQVNIVGQTVDVELVDSP